jgi:hypothetical protein
LRYAEIIYEDGSHSIASYEKESDLITAVKIQHERAVNGEPIHNSFEAHERPLVAVRVKRVLSYDRHPADFLPVRPALSADEMKSRFAAALKAVSDEDSVVDFYALVDHMTPQNMVQKPEYGDEATKMRHESNYHMPEAKEFSDKLWAV